MSITRKISPKLTLIGITSNDPELLTIKAAKALAAADVVFYESSSQETLLPGVPETALRIKLGKRNGQSYSQSQINSLIVDLAFTHGHVVHLVDGDPVTSGRAEEESAYAWLFNIETTVLPVVPPAACIRLNDFTFHLN